MRLALRLGKTLDELSRTMSTAEFRAWLAFNQLSPIGDERQDVLHAIGAYAALKPHTRKGSRLKVSDFVPNWSDEQKKQRVDSLVHQNMMGLVKNTGGKING